ncbi:triose-phosphate isomerase, partial [Candidatus Parcubacteria bacterium]|nr:triose-phosphate isomerase [Candidatus Parcubacteria bacterium]
MKKNKIVIANWKMKLSLAETLELAKDIKIKFKDFNKGRVVVCPSPVSLTEVNKILKGSFVELGAQNVFWEEKGAYTGEISAEQLVEAGCEYVIIGHSERRKYLLENYEMIHLKLKTVINMDNLIPIVCIGENGDERKTDRRDFVLVDQLHQALGGINILSDQRIIIAYEPIWAIGSGVAIEPEEAEYAHKIIKLTLNDMFGIEKANNNFDVIYGGSINSKNVKSFANIESIDGLLVGGASLDAGEFYKVAKAILKN